MAEVRPRTGAAAAAQTDTADQTPGEQAQASTVAPAPSSGGATTSEQPTSATAAGSDGTARKLFIAGMQDEFGPIEIPDSDDGNGKPVKYMLTRAGVDVAGPHVDYVRELARTHDVPLRSAKADEPAS